jgi:hypothetical protein
LSGSPKSEVTFHIFKAPVYAYFVHLEVPDEATSFSDNYFDLEPGEERTVIVTNNVRALSAENVKVGWR